jgi:hypothetical protein
MFGKFLGGGKKEEPKPNPNQAQPFDPKIKFEKTLFDLST